MKYVLQFEVMRKIMTEDNNQFCYCYNIKIFNITVEKEDPK